MSRLSPMIRAAVFVSNLERSRTFYEEVLGLREVFLEGELSEGNIHEVMGMPEGTHTRAVILKVSGPAVGMVGLFELSHPKPPPVSRDPERPNLGEACMVFYCDDLDAVMRKLQQGNHTIVAPPLALRIRGYVKQREMIFRDPDGAMINLIEWDPERTDKPELWQGEPE